MPEEDRNSDPDVDAPVSEADLSLMDRTKRQAKAAREQHRKKTSTLLSAEEEVLDLDEVLHQTRERVNATKAARSHAADLRRQLQELQEEEEEEEIRDSDQEQEVAATPDPTDAGAFVAASLKSAICTFLTTLCV